MFAPDRLQCGSVGPGSSSARDAYHQPCDDSQLVGRPSLSEEASKCKPFALGSCESVFAYYFFDHAHNEISLLTDHTVLKGTSSQPIDQTLRNQAGFQSLRDGFELFSTMK